MKLTIKNHFHPQTIYSSSSHHPEHILIPSRELPHTIQSLTSTSPPHYRHFSFFILYLFSEDAFLGYQKARDHIMVIMVGYEKLQQHSIPTFYYSNNTKKSKREGESRRRYMMPSAECIIATLHTEADSH